MDDARCLTQEMVFQRTKCNRLDLIRNLNLWGNNLNDVSILQWMPNLEVLSLSVNNVSTLEALRFCTKLTELYLRKNDIADLAEVHHLAQLRNLRVLWLNDNPCAVLRHYRIYVVHHLTNLCKLDSVDVTDEERREAASFPAEEVPTVAGPPPPPRPELGRPLQERAAAARPELRRGYSAPCAELPASDSEEELASPSAAAPPVRARSSQDPLGDRDRDDRGGRFEEERERWPPSAPRGGYGQGQRHVDDGRGQRLLDDGRGQRLLEDGRGQRLLDDGEDSPQARYQGEPRGYGAPQGYGRDFDSDEATPTGPGQGFEEPEALRRPPSAGGHFSDAGAGPFGGWLAEPQRAGGRESREEFARPPYEERGPPSARPGGGGGGGRRGGDGTDNILCAVLALIKELDAQGLELVRRAIEQRQAEV